MAIIAKYRLDGNANDVLGSNNGTATNVTWVDGKVNSAGSFNGSSSQISIADSTTMDCVGTSLTISAIIKPTSIGTYSIIHKESGGSPYGGYALYLINDGSVALSIRDSSNGSNSHYSAVGVISAGVWSHVVGVYNGTDIRIYINGILSGTPTSSTRTIGATNVDCVIGSTYAGGVYFNGLIDELEIYNTALTTAEIKNKYLFYQGLLGGVI